MFVVASLWSFLATTLFAGAVYFQKRCADIEAALSGEEPLMAFVGTACWRGSTKESQEYRRLMVAWKLTAILAMVQTFRVLQG